MNKKYSKKVLYGTPARTFRGEDTEVAFLIGGIGTGNYSIGSRGEMKDWEIFGTAGKGNYLPNTFFCIRCASEGNARVLALESKMQPPFSKSHGFKDYEVGGIPRFEKSEFVGEYPFCKVILTDSRLPLRVELEAFNPMIPLNSKDSSIPVGIMRYRVFNLSDKAQEVSVAGSLANFSALKKYERKTWDYYDVKDKPKNTYVEGESVRGLFYEPKTIAPDSTEYASMALTTPMHDITYKRMWLNGGWWDGLQDMMDDFSADGDLNAESHYTAKDAENDDSVMGSLCAKRVIPAGESALFEFYISWHFPYRADSWSEEMYENEVLKKAADGDGKIIKKRKYYATVWRDAWEVAEYVGRNFPRLYGDTKNFHDAFFSSTMPSYVLDAVSATMTVLRSPTCFRLEDGTLMAWEGCFRDEGCCEGNCTHVFNYAQTTAFLYPDLERSMRRVEYLVETRPDGKQNFRSYQMFYGMGGQEHVPAADGQLGTFIRFYRDWMISGDDDFLRELWPKVKSTLDFAFTYWDTDGDCVPDGSQFNTYDIAFTGPNAMISGLFFGALKAAERICEYLGDEKEAKRYAEAFRKGSRKADKLLFNGEYYDQKTDDVDEYRYQYGNGCLSDQLFGQTLAHIAGLGYVFPQAHVKKSLRSIFNYNFRKGFADHMNLQRTYALNDEHGLVLCSWPYGGRPKIPFPYSDEVWTGIEYQVAANLIYEGFIDEGLTLVKAVRDRHDGIRRNPFNEVECGYHYYRSMASFGVFLALSGYRYDLPHGEISFDPKINADNFSSFFINGKAWGVYTRKKNADGETEETTKVLYGDLGDIKVNGRR